MHMGLLALGLLCFLQPIGRIAADTKHDLVANPWGFLAGATSAWTDTFTFGQLQNQAYGYLFPHGLFFALTDPLPDWIAQRLWWWLVLGVGYSGMLLLLRRLGIVGPFAALAALLYALSPRSLSTLTTISSETWPIMLAPWVLWPLIPARLRLGNIAASILAVAAMGAVNATATLAACVPAGLLLAWRLLFDTLQPLHRRFSQLLLWSVGCILVSLWWIIPLLILGTYASPFTDFIENATVTTRWLNLAEILRGTTSWSPFVDAERQAGRLLVNNPVMIITTLLVATLGLIGLGKGVTNNRATSGDHDGSSDSAGPRKELPLKSYWWVLFGFGLILLGGASSVTEFLDGPGAALRNIHKFDLLIRLPLMVGFATLGASIYATTPSQRRRDQSDDQEADQLSLRSRTHRNVGGPASSPSSLTTEPRETAGQRKVGTTARHTTRLHGFHVRLVTKARQVTSWLTGQLTSQVVAEPVVDRRKAVATIGIVLVALAAMAPAWSARLLPLGSYKEVPEYWQQAADYLNDNAGDTRTLILPKSSFARQTWGWTRDEPAQPLLDVPWAVRDAIPLVDPETIRGLDGMSQYPTVDNLLRHGIGSVIIRHDLANDRSLYSAERLFPGYPTKRFGEVEIVMLKEGRATFSPADTNSRTSSTLPSPSATASQTPSATAGKSSDISPTDDSPAPAPTTTAPESPATVPTTDMYLVDESAITTVAGGGESLAFLPDGTYRLVDKNADIVTDTPLLAARNYGTVDSVTAPLAGEYEATDVHNPIMDYPSVGPRTKVEVEGAIITASSSASDATSFNGANPARSVTAAVDGDQQTAWYPRPGRQNGEWLEIHTPGGGMVENPVVEVTLFSSRAAAKTPRVEITIVSNQSHFSTFVTAGKPTKIPVPGGATNAVRLTLGASGSPVGVAEFSLAGVPLKRTVTVPSTSPRAKEFIFNQVFANTAGLQRQFFLAQPRQLTVQLSSCVQKLVVDGDTFECGDLVRLKPGWHDISTKARVVWLKAQGFNSQGATNNPLPDRVEPAAHNRLVVTNRSANSGLRGYVGDTALEPTIVNAGIQAFVVPAGVAGEFRLEFAGDQPFRRGLLLGGGVGLVTVVGCLIGVGRRYANSGRRHAKHINAAEQSMQNRQTSHTDSAPVALGGKLVATGVVAAGLTATVGWLALVVGLGCFAITRLTSFSPRMLLVAGMGMAIMWLPRAPWPAVNYAGDSLLLTIACTIAVWGMLLSGQGQSSN